MALQFKQHVVSHYLGSVPRMLDTNRFIIAILVFFSFKPIVLYVVYCFEEDNGHHRVDQLKHSSKSTKDQVNDTNISNMKDIPEYQSILYRIPG